jgi:glutathione S-transferase
MKLFYSPGSCAMSPHIVLAETGLPYALEKVDLATKTTESGEPLKSINEQDAVPALLLDSGEVLTEGAAIVQYIADQNPGSALLPPAATIERARVQQWLNYIATEMHKAHVPMFKADYPAAMKEIALENIKKAYDYVSAKLGERPFLTGDSFTVADAYLFTIINWHNFIKLDLSPWPVLVAYQTRVAARPAVRKAMAEEGLIELQAG